jgi:hypothetical protein
MHRAEALPFSAERPLQRDPGASIQKVWMNRPERSFGSNQVLFGGMI